jgi:hypothetical protein
VLAAAVLLPELAAMLFPSVAVYLPPGFVVVLVVLTFGYAALVWRTRAVLRWLFPGTDIEVPVQSRREKVAANVSAWIGVIVSTALLLRWLWGVL